MQLITEYKDVTKDTDVDSIDWHNIQFLTAIKSEGMITIQRAENIPQYGGGLVVIAYLKNFIRVMQSFGSNEFLDSLDDNTLWGIAMCLARGGAVPLKTVK